MSTPRNHQLDGWRAIAVLGVMWLHWAPRAWRGALPFEIGLYFFLALTGFLITRILLREKDRHLDSSEPWRLRSFRQFQWRRALRILVPCYVAMGFAWLVGAPDIAAHPIWYFAHLSNIHIAFLPEWPSGTAHYWTLAIQQQFYLVWPIFVFLTPARLLKPALLATVALAPISRAVIASNFPEIIHPGAITTCALDYLGCGALLALALHRGMAIDHRPLQIASWIALACYLPLYVLDELDRTVPVLCHLQQTFLSVAIVGLIAATLRGFPGIPGRTLEHPALQHVARLSYSLYLFHTTVPLALGWVLPVLWAGPDSSAMLALRLLVFFLSAWGVSWLSWRYIEKPLDRLRSRQNTA